jgi:collagen type III alpha
MATVLEQAKPAPVTRFDGIVEAKLAKAEGRIRGLDTVTGLLGFTIATFGYALVMALIDRWFNLAIGVRFVGFLGYAGFSAAWLGYWIVRPYLRSVNPYFAARRMEAVVPAAKNSVVNWLDLHDEPLPQSIKGAVGQRAAQDLGKVDLEQAINGRHTVWLGVSTLILGLTLFVLLVFVGLPQFLSLMKRSFFPFQLIETTHRTRLTMKTGDVTVPVEQPAVIIVGVEGRVPDLGQPDALKLFLRYRDADPYEDPIPLEQIETGRPDWQAIVPASRVRNGFIYKVRGGDDETGEYRVTVHTSPLINRFEVKHHYHKYLGWPDRVSSDPNLRDMVGTEIELIARTNRAIQQGSLELTIEKERKSIPFQSVKDDPQALLFRFPLEKSGHYGIRFTSVDGERYGDSMRYSLTVLADEAPKVKLTKPGVDVTLPANGMLQLEGDANDDVGVKALTLRMQVVDGPVLEPKKYRDGGAKKFLLADGSYPKMLDYKDFVDFNELKDAQGGKATLQPNKVLEYWLEAEDNCEPDAHTGASQHFKVVITPPDNNPQKQKQDRDQAKQDQKKQEEKQDQDLKKEGEQRQKDKEDKEKEGKPDQLNPKEDGKDSASKDDKRPGDQHKPGNEDGGKGGDGTDQKKKDEQKRIEEELKKAQDKADQQKGGGQDSKDTDDKKGDAKNDPAKEPKGDSKDQGKPDKEQKGEGKSEGKQGDQSKEKAEPKSEGDPKGSGAQDKAGEKGEGKPNPNESKGDVKEQKGEKQDNGSVKNEGKQESKPSPATDKGVGEGADKKDQATAKDEGTKPDPKNQPAEAKDADGKPKTDGKPEGVAKGEKPPAEKGEKKDGGKNSTGTDEAKATPKEDKKGDGAPKANDKPAKKDDAGNTGVAKGDKPGQDAKPEDVAKMVKDAQGADDQKKEDLAEKLDQIRRNAQDPKAREDAEKALDQLAQAKKGADDKVAKAKDPPPKPDDSEKNGGPPAQAKDGPKKDAPVAGEGKDDPNHQKNEDKGQPKDSGIAKTGDEATAKKNEVDPKNPTDAQVKENTKKGDENTTAKRGSSEEDKNPTKNDYSDRPPGAPGDPDNLKKAQLQLENIRKLLKEHPELIDKTNVTRKQVEKYVEMRQQEIDELKQANVEAVKDPSKTPGQPLNDLGATRVKSPDATSGKENGPGTAAPPPEFRDMYYKKFIGGDKKPNKP